MELFGLVIVGLLLLDCGELSCFMGKEFIYDCCNYC